MRECGGLSRTDRRGSGEIMSKFQIELLMWFIVCAVLWTAFGLVVILIGYDPGGLLLFLLAQIGIIVVPTLGYLSAKLKDKEIK